MSLVSLAMMLQLLSMMANPSCIISRRSVEVSLSLDFGRFDLKPSRHKLKAKTAGLIGLSLHGTTQFTRMCSTRLRIALSRFRSSAFFPRISPRFSSAVRVFLRRLSHISASIT